MNLSAKRARYSNAITSFHFSYFCINVYIYSFEYLPMQTLFHMGCAQVARLKRTATQETDQVFAKYTVYVDEDIEKRPRVTWLLRACGAKVIKGVT